MLLQFHRSEGGKCLRSEAYMFGGEDTNMQGGAIGHIPEGEKQLYVLGAR